MVDRRIAIVDGCADGEPQKSKNVAKKGPNRALVTKAQFLPADQRRAIVKAFHIHGQSIEFIGSRTRITRLVVQDIVRMALDDAAGRKRHLEATFGRRAA